MNPNQHPIRLLLILLLSIAASSAPAFTAGDSDTMLSSYNSAFYTVDGTNGFIKDTQTGGVAYFWGQAEMIECVIDAYEWTGDPAYQAMITNLLNGFLTQNGFNWTSWNIYNDDIMWAVLAFARGGVDTGNPDYCDIARANFDACYARGWDNVLGGGLWWRTDNAFKNAAVNGPAAIAAHLMYQIYGDSSYLDKANDIYNWERSVLFNTNTGAIYDGIEIDSTYHYWSSAYNQGTFIGAAHFLGHTNDAMLAANFMRMHLTSGGILPAYGIADNNSGFNAIFLRWMTRFMKDRGLQDTYEPWLQLNASAAWNRRRTSDNLSWCQWLQPTPVGTNFYAWDCISSFEAMLAVDPTQGSAPLAVPRDAAGCWPLDETSGSVASNTAWNGNHGTVNVASWNPAGRVNGCMEFNGINSTVQLANPVVNDFSIVFWVRTTQTAGAPQWYHGAGLVDGDVPFNNSDFGTALVGGKFGFGVGNTDTGTDTTIVSTTSINDGAWHHCVATRQQATGVLSIYVDGTLEATDTATRNSLNAPAQLLLGATGGNYFDGSLDEVGIFAKALGSNDVAALYSSSVLPPSAAPADLVAAAIGNVGVQLSWSEASLATSYNLKRSLISGGPYVLLTNVTSSTYTDVAVLNNRTYCYVVSAVNAVGESGDSPPASASPSTLRAWLKADAILGVADGAAVSMWPDLSGNGFDAVQPLGDHCPAYVTAAINGLPAVRFDSANSSYLWLYRPVEDDFTILFVYQSSQGLNTGIGFWEGAGLVNGEVVNQVDDFGVSLNANGQILAGTGNPDTSIHSNTGFNDGQPHVVTFTRTRSTGIIRLYVDGIVAATAVGGTQSLTAPNTLILGAQGVLNSFLSGDIAEVQVYSSALSDIDRIGHERALKCRYGLAGGAPPFPPTGLTATAGNREIGLNWTLTPGATDYNLWRSTNNGASYELLATGLTSSSHVDTNAVSGQMNLYRIAPTNGCGEGAKSAPAGVFLPLPALELAVSAEFLEIRWPGWASDWALDGTTDLTPPTVWTAVTNTVIANNGQFEVSLPMDIPMRFFRLSSP